MIAYDRDVRQLLYRQRKGLSTAENRIAGQEHDWPGELYVTLRFEVPGLRGCKVIFAWANLRLPAKGNSPAVAKPIDDRDCNTILSPGLSRRSMMKPSRSLKSRPNLSRAPIISAF